MKRVLILTNLPTPYKIKFYNELSKFLYLTVIFEGRVTSSQKFNWIDHKEFKFEYFFLRNRAHEKKVSIKFFKVVFSKKWDRVLVTSYHCYNQVILQLLARLGIINTDFVTDGGFPQLKENFFRMTAKKAIFRASKRFFSPSKVSDSYIQRYVTNPIIIRYPFTSVMEKDIVDELQISKKEKKKNKLPVVISVGQFIHRKGFDLLISAKSLTKTEFELKIIGGTPTDEYVQIIEKLSLTNVSFESFKEQKELYEEMSNADLFVLPTREDIWGLVINEAMALGLPIISTNMCIAALEMLSNESIVESENIVELAARIDFFLASGKRYGVENRKIVERYTIENMARIFSENI